MAAKNVKALVSALVGVARQSDLSPEGLSQQLHDLVGDLATCPAGIVALASLDLDAETGPAVAAASGRGHDLGMALHMAHTLALLERIAQLERQLGKEPVPVMQFTGEEGVA